MRPDISFLVALIALTPAINADSDSFVVQQTTKEEEIFYLDAYVNGEKRDGVIPVVLKDDSVWVSKSVWNNLQLTLQPDIENNFNGEVFLLVPGDLNPKIDVSNLSLYLHVPAQYLPITVIKPDTKTLTRATSNVGFYSNYYLFLSHDPLANNINFSSHHKTVIASPYGSLTNSFLTRLGKVNRLVRLDSYYTIDFPSKNLFLVLGDFFTDVPSWSSSTPMLGIKLEKHYKFVPDFLSYPTLDLAGYLMSQGELEIRLHDTSYLKKKMPMGRFYLENPALPVGGHSGDLIVRDKAGILQIMPFSYYIDASFLRPGLSTFSYALGFMRNNYGVTSFDYQDPILSLRQRWGVTQIWTPELHVEASFDNAILSNEQRIRIFDFASSGFTSAINLRQGSLYPLLGSDILLNKFGINARVSGILAFPHFKTLGQSLNTSKNYRASLQTHLRIDKDFIRHTSLNHSFMRQHHFRQNTFYILQNLPFSNRWQININASYDFFKESFGVFALLSIFLDKHSVNVSAETQEHSFKTTAQYSYNTTTDEGNRYRLSSGASYDRAVRGYAQLGAENQYIQGGLQLNGGVRNFNYGVQLGGCVGCIETQCFIARPIEHSFALFKIPEQKNIKIGREFGGVIGRTDSRGNLLIANLRPYEEVKLQALTRDLDPRISTEHIEKGVTFYPGFNTAHTIELLAPNIRRIMLKLTKNTKPLAAGGTLTIVGVLEKSLVGNRGMVYLEIPENLSVIEGKSDVDDCSFFAHLPKNHEDIVEDLGEINCQ